MIALPFLVRERTKKPWVRLRLVVDGWYVLLLMHGLRVLVEKGTWLHSPKNASRQGGVAPEAALDLRAAWL